jgi:hypothetical protein
MRWLNNEDPMQQWRKEARDPETYAIRHKLEDMGDVFWEGDEVWFCGRDRQWLDSIGVIA